MKVLVTGSAGYIGSHTVIDLIKNGFEVIGIDNLSNSSPRAYERITELTGIKIQAYHADLTQIESLHGIFKNHSDIKAIIHFAALKSVEESVAHPMKYFENNVSGLLNLLKLQSSYSIPHFIFSSSCTVYGNATELPVTEKTITREAESPYGRSKQIGEGILKDLANGKTNIISLRYFNPAGAHPSGRLGEAAINEIRNLVPLIMETGMGKRDSLKIFGSDYPTRDGTCIRDYIHIMDLASAHTQALQYLIAGKNQSHFEVYNLGSGSGVTILEAIQSFEKITGSKLNYTISPRRPGDVEAIYADHRLATEKLGWTPKYSLDDIMSSAWTWEHNKTEFLKQD